MLRAEPGIGRDAGRSCRRPRPRAVRGGHPPRRRPPRSSTCPTRLADLGHLRRRLLPGGLRRDAATWPAPGPATTGFALFMPLDAARHAARRRTRSNAASPTCGCARPGRWRRTRGGVPHRGRGHDRQLAVGAGQPGAEPDPRPGRLHRDAPQDLRLRPDDEPVPAGHADDVPPEIYRTRADARRWRPRRTDYACCSTTCSRTRRRSSSRASSTTCVLVVQNFLDCDRRRPRATSSDDLMTARMRQFQHIVDRELPARSTAPASTRLRARRSGATRRNWNWLAGILDWHQGCHRYAEADLIGNMRPARPELLRSPARPDSSQPGRTRQFRGPRSPHAPSGALSRGLGPAAAWPGPRPPVAAR